MASNTIHVGACPTCGALAQAIAGEATTYRHIATRPADSDKSKPQMMINRSGEVHNYSPDCRGECSDAETTLVSDWAWQAALEINREGDSGNTIPITKIIEKHYLPDKRDALQSVERAAKLIAIARDGNGPPDNPPSMLWSALCNIWDHLDILQQEIAAGKYDNKGPFEPKATETAD